MAIQWFPGHMRETREIIRQSIKKTDGILEILDARLPLASANPFVDRICQDTFRLKVLNKADLADPVKTDLWLRFFEKSENTAAIAISATSKTQADMSISYCHKKITRNRARKLKLMVMGIPNTGKSTILNTLAGKKVAKTGNVPAITRHTQRISLKNNIDIYDTPGILWPVIEPEKKAYILAASGAISDSAIDYTDIGFFAAGFLLKFYPDLVMQRYKFLNALPSDACELVEKIGAARGCLRAKGRIDLHKASQILIRELRTGKIGRISFETPKDLEHDNE
jgi:ribosome biogenesis GTPase A